MKWKESNVLPLHKKGDKSQPSNYRPISLLSNIAKLQKRIVFKNIYNHLHDNNLLYKYHLTIQLPINLSTYTTTSAKLLTMTNFPVRFSVTCPKHLIECGTEASCLNSNNMELQDPFLNGFRTISVIEHNESPLNFVFPVLGLYLLECPRAPSLGHSSFLFVLMI